MTHIGEPLAEVLKEVARRCDLRARLEAEWERPLTDAEFLVIADQTGWKL